MIIAVVVAVSVFASVSVVILVQVDAVNNVVLAVVSALAVVAISICLL